MYLYKKRLTQETYCRRSPSTAPKYATAYAIMCPKKIIVCKKRNLPVQKETYLWTKRPTQEISCRGSLLTALKCATAYANMRRKTNISARKETCLHEKRPTQETCLYEKRPTKETYLYEKRPTQETSWMLSSSVAPKYATSRAQQRVNRTTYLSKKRTKHISGRQSPLETRVTNNVVVKQVKKIRLQYCSRQTD